MPEDGVDYQNPIPSDLPNLDDQTHRILNLYLQEWAETLETQRHFNDLILRFRRFTLTAFLTGLGAAIVARNLQQFSGVDLSALIYVLLAYWVGVAVLDLGYYFRLLLGAVDQGRKFDQGDDVETYGLFGLNANIRSKISPTLSYVLLAAYYLVPATVGLILWYWFLVPA